MDSTIVFDSPNVKSTLPAPRWLRIKRKEASDRFIPNRGGMNIEKSQYLLGSSDLAENSYQQNLKDCLLEGNDSRILAFKGKAPQTMKEDLRRLFQTKPNIAMTNQKSSRFISASPERILDAPDMLDDYYLNLLDWSMKNILAVALNQSVYVWNASTGSVSELLSLEEGKYVSSVKWMQDGSYLAVGTSDSAVQLWDIESMEKVRTMRGHQSRVGSLAWNRHLLSSGSRDAAIFNHDVRIANHRVSSFLNHTQEVCGLEWSTDGSLLASGGNDNILNIWDPIAPSPKFTCTQHKAAVKAVAWCPWQSNLLATGGGSYDKTIKFWNTQNGTCLTSVDTGSQVCALRWSLEHKEIVSSHGLTDNQITIWKYPTMTKVTELYGHSSRVLHLAMSPDGESIVSGAADENLKFWRCFESKAKNCPTQSNPYHKLEKNLNKIIR